MNSKDIKRYSVRMTELRRVLRDKDSDTELILASDHDSAMTDQAKVSKWQFDEMRSVYLETIESQAKEIAELKQELLGYKMGADAEARAGDEARAEAEMYRQNIDCVLKESDARAASQAQEIEEWKSRELKAIQTLLETSKRNVELMKELAIARAQIEKLREQRDILILYPHRDNTTKADIQLFIAKLDAEVAALESENK